MVIRKITSLFLIIAILRIYKSFYDFASRYYGIDNLLAGSAMSPAAFKSLHSVHVFDVPKYSERLAEGVVAMDQR